MEITQQRNRVIFSFALALAATLLALALTACAPASGGEGVDVGDTSPPFAMTLEDGTQVSLKNLVEDNQATHLFWFATW